MATEKYFNLNHGCVLNSSNKKIVINLATGALLSLITQELKTRYSPETQKLALEGSSKLLPDYVFQ